MSERVDMERLRRLCRGDFAESDDRYAEMVAEDGLAILELIDAAVEWHADMDGDECVDRLGEAVEPFLPEEES